MSIAEHLSRSKRSDYSYPDDRPQQDQSLQPNGRPISLIVESQGLNCIHVLYDLRMLLFFYV